MELDLGQDFENNYSQPYRDIHNCWKFLRRVHLCEKETGKKTGDKDDMRGRDLKI